MDDRTVGDDAVGTDYGANEPLAADRPTDRMESAGPAPGEFASVTDHPCGRSESNRSPRSFGRNVPLGRSIDRNVSTSLFGTRTFD